MNRIQEERKRTSRALGFGWVITAALLVFLTLLGGCMGATLPYNPEKMQADQLKALVSDKNAAVTCATTDTPYKGNVIYLNLDKGVLVRGIITVKRDCEVVIQNLVNDPLVKP